MFQLSLQPPPNFEGEPRRAWVVTIGEMGAARLLVNSREPAACRGEIEPIDHVARHIPEAASHHFALHLREDGRFIDLATLRERLERTLDGVPSENPMCCCGSEVSACQDLLALARGGRPPARLYVGSRREWSSNPGRPAATGEE